jgi:hypothetical protein
MFRPACSTSAVYLAPINLPTALEFYAQEEMLSDAAPEHLSDLAQIRRDPP